MTSTPLTVGPGIDPNWEDLGEDTWTRIEGGTLDAPIYVRVALAADGREVINGIMIGGAWPRNEITANSLRNIKIGEILGCVFDGWSLADPPDPEDLGEQISWGLMHETYIRQSERIPSTSKSGSRGAPKARLDEFAQIYLHQRNLNAHRAMTATAEALNISRATANRWVALCRERGILPPKPPAGG